MQPIYSIVIGYGSESGNAEALAQQLYQQDFLQNYDLSIQELNNVDINHLNQNSLFIIITSSFGDGEAPANAEDFLEHLQAHENQDYQYCIFGIGDVTYTNFCGFSKHINEILSQQNNPCIIETVDADLNYQAIFKQWLPLLENRLKNPQDEPVQHQLSVKVYGANSTYPAEILEIKRLAQAVPEVYHLRLSLKDSGIFYQAGDLIYVKIEQPQDLLQQFAEWFNDDNAINLLKEKELRLLSKSVLRDLGKINGNDALKDLVKISNKKQLEQYIHGHDVLDVLRTFDAEKKISLQELADTLGGLNARAYSISSCGQAHPDYVDLCVRHVYYSLDGRDYQGTASSYLAQCKVGDKLNIFAQSNPTFQLPEKLNAPVVMIASGTGIAPHISFLQHFEYAKAPIETYLFFGERYRAKDFLYEKELQQFLDNKALTQLFTAFSRDQAEKFYVQDAIKQQGELVWKLIEQGAYFYICGSKTMSKSVDETLIEIAEKIGNTPYVDDFNNIIATLIGEGRLFRDVY